MELGKITMELVLNTSQFYKQLNQVCKDLETIETINRLQGELDELKKKYNKELFEKPCCDDFSKLEVTTYEDMYSGYKRFMCGNCGNVTLEKIT